MIDLMRMRIFKNIAFLDGQHFIYVMTWEQINISNSETIHVKTLRLFDTSNQPRKTVLVEVVPVKHPLPLLNNHDVSNLQLGDHLYYFKRVHGQDSIAQLSLHKLNLRTYEEQEVPGYCLKEQNNEPMTSIFS